MEPQTEGDRSVFLEVKTSRTDAEAGVNLTVTVGRETLALETEAQFTEEGLTNILGDVRSSLSPLGLVNGRTTLKRGKDSGWTLVVDGTSQWDGINSVLFNGNYW